ncbi:MAG: hypothetical protein K2M89_04635 [Clostridiales bacterium]|nr:hypothetical protein [Clostridiales bacterium]
MISSEKIPIIVGETGHRNIADEDKAEIKARVIDSLKEIQALCKCDDGEDTPVIMLNAFAQGADMLCAEAAFELGIDVVAILPRDKDLYVNSFTNAEDKNKLFDYLSRCKRIFVAPDIEKNKEWIQKHDKEVNDDSYEYRQLGIYIAEHSHVLLALWDGKPPKDQFGCGTVEVIKFTLEHNFLDNEHLFKPGTINDSAVVWIKSRRQGDPPADVEKKWLISGLESDGEKSEYVTSDAPPQFLKEIISKTVKYNANTVDIPREPNDLWGNTDELDEYRKNVQYHYAKADGLSYKKNQKQYNMFMMLIAVIGTIVACSFLIYDEASLPFMIFPCSFAVGAIILLCRLGRKKAYHKNYIEYRALAEAMRIQFYMSMCLQEDNIVTNVGELYSWAQKIDCVWIDKAVRAIAVISNVGEVKPNTDDIMEAWIGRSKKSGQLGYHERKRIANKSNAKKYETLSGVTRCAAVVTYFAIFAMEIAACILKAYGVCWFWEGNIFAYISWRNFCAIILGIAAAGSLLFSSYWGKLSFDRKLEDNEKMCEFYSSAYARWNEVKRHPDGEIAKFVKEIAREEIVENGIWYSYVKGNGLEVNI